MRLTRQMIFEAAIMNREYDRMAKAFLEVAIEASKVDKVSFEDEEKCQAIIAELNPYKVRLENILCETDIKEQAHEH